MHIDVVELRRFYYRTRIGQAAQRALRERLLALWSDAKGLNVAGYGFATPFLRPFKEQALRSISMMPAQQGAFHWPNESPNISVLVNERKWPLPTGFLDRLIIAHALENSDRPAAILSEVHRTLSADGRALIVVPNRTGIWARRESTPFGHGRPYTIDQLETQLRQFSLEPINHTAALYFPPSSRRFWVRGSGMLERFGQRLDVQRFAGAIIVEVQKTAYASPRGRVATGPRLPPIGVLGGVGRPRPRPVNECVHYEG